MSVREHCYVWLLEGIKGELQCKTTLCGVKEGQKIRFSSISVFLLTPPLKEKSPFFEKLVLLARRSAAERNKIARRFEEERNKIARSFGGEKNKITRSFGRKGIEY